VDAGAGLHDRDCLGLGIEVVGAGDRLCPVALGVEDLDGVVVLDGDQHGLDSVPTVGEAAGVEVPEAGLEALAAREAHPLAAPAHRADEDGTVPVVGVDHVAGAEGREVDREGHPVDLVPVLVLGDQGFGVRNRAAELPGQLVGDPLADGGRRDPDVDALGARLDLGDEGLPVAGGLHSLDDLRGDLPGALGLLGGGLAPVGPDLDRRGVVVAGDAATAGAGLAGDHDRNRELFLDGGAADDSVELTVHADGVLVDLLGVDPPSDLPGVDVDGQRLGDLLDGHVGVVAGAHVHPAVAAVDRPAGRTHCDLDALGGLNQVEALEVAGVAEPRRPRAVGALGGRLWGDRLPALRAEPARVAIAHWGNRGGAGG
jgi:hypothetical protein